MSKNIMKSANRYEIYEVGNIFYYFLFDSRRNIICMASVDDIDNNMEVITNLEQASYRYSFGNNKYLKFVAKNDEFRNKEELYRNAKRNGVLVADEKGRYESRFGELSKRAFRVRPYYFVFKEAKEQLDPNNTIMESAYVVVMASSKNEACDWFGMFYPSRMLNYIACSDYYTEEEWETKEKAEYEKYTLAQTITRDDVKKCFGTLVNMQGLWEKPKKRLFA